MDIPFSRWYSAIEKRRSRRHFDPDRPIEPEIMEALNSICEKFKPFPHARSCCVTTSVNDVFKGIIGSYGKIKNPPAFIAFIGNMDAPSVQEEVGYAGEGIILEATALGLSTCWVGGFFRRKSVTKLIELDNNERVFAVTPVGYALTSESLEEKLMTGFGRTHKRRSISSLIKGYEMEKLPEWVKKAVEAARFAPSAVNRQPWSFQVENDGITVSLKSRSPKYNISRRLDCGIAMLHIEVAALNSGYKGKWEFLQHPKVAKFTIQP